MLLEDNVNIACHAAQAEGVGVVYIPNGVSYDTSELERKGYGITEEKVEGGIHLTIR